MGFFRRKAYELLSSLLDGGGGASLLMLGTTPSGKVVTPGTALQVSAVWACNKILSECVGMLPLSTYKRLGADATAKATDHPLYRLLHDEPNPEMAAMDFRMSMQCALGIWGNAYAKIARNGSGKPVALWPLPAQLVRPDRDPSGNLIYRYTPPSGGKQDLDPSEVFHARSLSLDGIRGISPISQLRNPIGLAAALEEYAGRFFSNGGVPGIVLQHPGKLTSEAIENIRKSWKSMYGGVENSNDVAVTEEGMTAQVVSFDPQKSQSVESRKFQLGEIARIYRVPPHMLADLDRATFSNIEQQSIEFVTYTLMPWLKIWEQAIQRSLFAEKEKATYFAEFNVDGLLRGDIASRYAAYAVGRQWGWLSRNDIRGLENMNPIKDGDDYLTPLNMIPSSGTAPTPPAQIPARPDKKLLEISRELHRMAAAA